MPIHEYKCEPCDVVFEQFFKTRSEVTDQYPCCFCGAPATKVISAANFTWGTPTMTRDGNSGVYAVDFNLDQVVGRDAKKRKLHVEQREKAKREARRQSPSGVLTRDRNGEYTGTPQKIVSARNTLAGHVNQAYRDARSGRGGWREGESPSPS
jgi:putative FmdB family regulatory protein